MRNERCGNCRHYKPRTSECGYGGDVEPTDRRCYQYERDLKREEGAEQDGETGYCIADALEWFEDYTGMKIREVSAGGQLETSGRG